MEFLRPEAEGTAIREAVRRPKFLDATTLTVSFRTDPDAVERLLPPGLDPADRPLARAEVVSVGRSNCVGPFDGGGLYVRARHGDREGAYCLSMPMSTDAAVRWGRETLGEPKKRADVTLDWTGASARGTVTRHGERLVDIDARLTGSQEPRSGEATVFHYKYLPAASGEGFHTDPDISLSAEEIATVDPEDFEPYAFGVGMDDWLALANE